MGSFVCTIRGWKACLFEFLDYWGEESEEWIGEEMRAEEIREVFVCT